MTAYDQVNQPDTGEPSMQSDETDGIAAHLRNLAAAGQSADRVAHEVASAFLGIDQVLAPIVGQRGAAALYKRALHLAKRAFPWLPDGAANATIDVGPLTAALAAQTATDAALAGARALQDFHLLLTSLIGPSLTERLLRSVWAPFLSSPSAQDNTQ